jgi:hypothetical protein
MNFGELKAHVQSAMGRSDVPSFVYDLTTSGLNADLRLLEMQEDTTLIATTEEVGLPFDFLEMESAYIDAGGARRRLVPSTEMAQAVRHDPSGQPYYYAIHDGKITLMPVPDGPYTISIRYYQRLSDLVEDGDINPVLLTYPGLYMYQALIHAAVWARDMEAVQAYSAAYTSIKDIVEKQDRKRRFRGPMIQRSAT